MTEPFDNLNKEAEDPKEPEAPEVEPEEPEKEPEIPEKFRDKTKEDVIKSYSEVEKKLHEQAERLAALEKEKENATSAKEVKEIKKEISDVKKEVLDEIEKADYTNMEPKGYAKFLIEKIEKMTEAIADKRAADSEKKASEIFARETSFREKVRQDVESVKKDYPIMKDETERGDAFREVVLDIISASKGRGKEITLKEAVEKALKLVGETKDIKKPKPIEKPQPFTPGENTSEEDEVKDRIKRAGGGGVLGGL